MSSGWYPKGAEAVLNKLIDWNSDTLKVALVEESAAFNAAHDNYDDISADVVGTPQTLTSPTIANGVFDAADVSFAALSGAEIGALVIYKDTGTPSTSTLLLWLDDYAGLPFTPDGSDLPIVFSSQGIMRAPSAA